MSTMELAVGLPEPIAKHLIGAMEEFFMDLFMQKFSLALDREIGWDVEPYPESAHDLDAAKICAAISDEIADEPYDYDGSVTQDVFSDGPEVAASERLSMGRTDMRPGG